MVDLSERHTEVIKDNAEFEIVLGGVKVVVGGVVVLIDPDFLKLASAKWEAAFDLACKRCKDGEDCSGGLDVIA